MSDLQTINDIKIPYATEGVIRTAQLDDTVAPANSVQLAINMNFDRVGAIQTRPGVTEYADALAEAIENYGTLNNSIVPPGQENLFFLAQNENDISGYATEMSAVNVNAFGVVKITAFWAGFNNSGFVQNFSIDSETGAIFPTGTALNFYSQALSDNKALYMGYGDIAPIIVVNAWRGEGGDAFIQGFGALGDSVVAFGSPLEFDTFDGSDFSLVKIDNTHILVFYTSTAGVGKALVITLDVNTGFLSVPASALTFEAGVASNNSAVAVGDGTHFINYWNKTGTGGKAQCFTVNTGTWAITAEGSPITYDTGATNSNAFSCGDGSHFVNIFVSADNTAKRAQAFALNLGTFAVTQVGTGVNFAAGLGVALTATFLDGNHFVAFYSQTIGVGYVQLLKMDLVTFNMSVSGIPLIGYDFAEDDSISALNISSSEAVVFSGVYQETQMRQTVFVTTGNIVSGKWLYAGYSSKVANLPAGSTTWTDRRTGLAEVSKPRFAQFLGYIWMVNGNQNIGGNSPATSKGGDFGNDLVPPQFPAGDFIHAGFEGRVWVANKTLGIIYYTDIVQFNPPASYSLTYNPNVNFITTISPQTGEFMTALQRTPRALLVFTQNTITRIYGASSIDAYPAYNVGTFSQESIIETKTGIFFHHSSGFYQFDYGGQPVEISRRIIDFVKAIPRDNYDDITGVYDGFDNVEWSVGQVVVEGVVYEGCVVRYTISTQIWTVYDYKNIDITAMIYYDDGVNLNHLVGDDDGRTGQLDVGDTDYDEPFYFEFIDRWRSFTDVYYKTKSITGVSVYSENAAGSNLMYQVQKSGPNAWKPIGTVSEENNSIMPNSGTDDFDVLRLRLVGNTKGPRVVVHGIEITSLTIKGQEKN